MRKRILALPGNGPSLEVNFDAKKLIKIIKKEIEPLLKDPLQGRPLPENSPITIRIKGSSTPLKDSGQLLDKIILKEEDGGLTISVADYYWVLPKEYKQLLHIKDILKAVNKAKAKFIKESLKIKAGRK